ncbi:MAG: hypothetical protein M1541_10165 [Acidobacteria bacterium]|nr:hypothetical protein [Acidobacteriota bacterium]
MWSAESTRTRLGGVVLVGLQSGTLAALAMLGWLALASAWYRRSIWSVPNLLASTFYGDSALRNGFTSTTVSGIALYLAIYGLFGALFGLAVQDRWRPLRITLIAVAASLAWYYLSFGLIWKAVNPLVVLYTHDTPMLIGHIIYGALLGRYPVYLKVAEQLKIKAE